MSDQTRRVWRAGPVTLVLVFAFALAAGVVIPILAYLIYRNDRTLWLPALFVILTVLALLYAWRFGLHPRLEVTDQNVKVINPFRRYSFEWDDITVIAPGENGLLIGSEDTAAEVWCVQKSKFASRHGRLTRADRIANQLLDIVELHDPPTEDEEEGSRIRRARSDESQLLTQLERAASERALAHIFPPEQYPYPTSAVAWRWRQLLRNRLMHAYLLEVRDSPVGYVAFNGHSVHYLGVVSDHQWRGYGSALLEFACMEIYGAGAREAFCWVLADNQAARTFYRGRGWTETGARRQSEYPPHPESIQLMRKNPHPPRRSL